jgi:hypothetical protein
MIECGSRLGKASSAGPVATMLMRRSDRIGGVAPRQAARTTILYAFDLIAHNGEEPRDRPSLERRPALALVLRNTKAGLVFNERIAKDAPAPLRPCLVCPVWIKIGNPASVAVGAK